MDNFLENLSESLSGIDPNSDKVLLGDFNINFSTSRAQSSERIYINENLTQFRRNLVNEASKLKRNRGGPVLNLWTIDGKIFVKTSPGGAPVRIYSTGDLSDL